MALYDFAKAERPSLNRFNAPEDIQNALTLYANDCAADGYEDGQALAAELKDYLRKKTQ